ncbi:hypothetical protein L6V77_35160, partial [Myxococcota bacterium]|nr:hypothetical protein [Myxococcota bacterium]
MSCSAERRWRAVVVFVASLVSIAGCGDDGPPPPETCNHLDDDGDGVVDEPYVDADGRYLTTEHCGHCGLDCATVFPGATVACRLVDGAPSCVIAGCPAGQHAVEGGCVPDAPVQCAPCHVDADCAAWPDARCLGGVAGAHFCAHPCAPAVRPGVPEADAGAADTGFDARPFSPDAETGPAAETCDPGFVCTESGGARVCLPESGRCGCTPDQAGARFGCVVESPTGASRCAGERRCDGTALSACSAAPTEICNGRDDDCDDLADEDFLVDGLYGTADHCGGCDAPCATGAPNMTATCVTTPGAGDGPRCVIECAPGFADLDGARLNGCECEQVAASWPPGAHGVDGDCDGRVDESDAYIYVAQRGRDDNPGTLDAPVATIARGLELGAQRSQPVFVAQGRYAERVTLRAGVSLFGGYRSDFGARDLVVFASVIELPDGPVGAPVLLARDIDASTAFEGFTLVGGDAQAAGGGSTTAFFEGCGPALEVRDLVVRAGAGADGAAGASSSALLAEAGFESLDVLDGVDGRPGERGLAAGGDACVGLLAPGGRAGPKSCPLSGLDVGGGAGASADCPETDCRLGQACGNSGCTDFTVGETCDTEAMYRAAVANAGGEAGRGPGAGAGGEATYDSPTPVAGDCFCEDNPTLRREGAPGTDGAPGLDGRGGLGSPGGGRFDPATGLWSGGDGTDGTDGADGGGAGGGSHGAGYDVLSGNFNGCVDHTGGGGGGGGS